MIDKLSEVYIENDQTAVIVLETVSGKFKFIELPLPVVIDLKMQLDELL